ncbi:MAG: hypothetical protein ACM30I_03465 [Gemmatimonas sp.]
MTAPCIRNLAAFTVSIALATALPAAAQTSPAGPGLNAPTPLWPTPRSRDEAPKGEPGSPTSEATETAIGGIRIDELAPLSIASDGVGTIDGLGADMWRGTSRALVSAYLPRLPAPSTSPAQRALARKLLLTSAVPPPAADGAAPESLLSARLAALAALGDADDFIALARAVPSASDEPSIRAQIEAALLAGDDATACATLSGATRVAAKGEFWNRATVLCDVVGGRTAQAQLALDLMGEQGVPADSPYVVLLRDALGERKPVTSLAGVGPLEVALLRLAKAPLTPEALADASPLALRAIAVGGGDITARLDAAERAEAFGAIPTAKLAEIYAAVPFKADEMGNALTLAGNDSSPRGRALFYKAEQQARGVPAAAAEAIEAALASAREQGRFAQAARVYAADIAGIEPAPELQWFAQDAARALYAAGSVAQAEAWRTQAARAGDASGDTPLWPLAAIAAVPKTGVVTAAGAVPPAAPRPFDVAGFNRWVASLPQPERLPKGAQVLTLLDAMGARVPPEVWAPYLDAATAARSSPLLGPMTRAADGGRVGEVVLLALTALGSGDPALWSAETVGSVGAALNRVNLGGDAAALVLDSAVASGL